MSLGLEPLPPTFFERSLFVKPADREVVCHASAWDHRPRRTICASRCASITTAEDFITIHHELGHNFYQRAYKHLPSCSATAPTTVSTKPWVIPSRLSVTPEYLVKVGLLASAPDASGDIGLLLQRALAKVAFLPFGLLVDQWRWKVFRGRRPPANYNEPHGGRCG